MTIYKVMFDKGDFALSIKYHENGNDLTVETNEEPKQSFSDAKADLGRAIRNYLDLSAAWGISLKSVTFGNGKKSISVVTKVMGEYPERKCATTAKLCDVGEREENPAQSRVMLIEKIEQLEKEVADYLRGSKAQGELDFTQQAIPDGETETDAETSEIDIDDDMLIESMR